jgi:hypothetical protein
MIIGGIISAGRGGGGGGGRREREGEHIVSEMYVARNVVPAV